MTAPFRPSAPDCLSRVKPAALRREMSFAFDTDGRRRWFADLMWRAFPGGSLREKALVAGPVLGLTPRQCENLMKGAHDAKLGTILAVLTVAGAENIFTIIRGNELEHDLAPDGPAARRTGVARPGQGPRP